MHVDAAVKQSERFAKHPVQFVRRVPRHWKPAARRRSARPKRSDDGEAVGFQCLQDLGDVAITLITCGHEVKHRAVMPDVESTCRQFGLQNVGGLPDDMPG